MAGLSYNRAEMRLPSLLSLLLLGSLLLPAQPYVRVSPRDSRYLELSDGKPYIPIGLNMVGGPDLDRWSSWLSALADHRGNYIRVWLSHALWDVEHQRSGVYDEEKARRIDAMLELCRRRGVYVKMTLEHFRSVGGGRQPWADKPLHNVANGGTAPDIAGFFNLQPSRDHFISKIRWYRERYGSQPIIYGWELWNEVNAVNGAMRPGGPDVMAWTEVMLAELHKSFPQNLALQSLGSFDTGGVRDLYRRHSLLPGNDTAQVHRYLDPGAPLEICHGAVDVLAADAVRELLAFQPGKPVLLAESGAVESRHSGPSKLYAPDKEGLILHDVLFAPFFAGAAGPGQIWHWDQYVAANNLWHHFDRFAQLVDGIDPPAERFEPSMLPHPRLRIYRLQGRTTTLFWLRDSQPAGTVRSIRLPCTTAGARVFDPWQNRWTTVRARRGRIELPAFTTSLAVVMK